VQKQNKKPVIGILGAIASGKSTVAKELQTRGCAVIDADTIAKDFLKLAEVKQQIRQRFGDAVFDPAGAVDRAKLADVVFDDLDALQAINDIIHPRVMKEVEALMEQFQNDPKIKAVVLDVPLLLEVGWEKRCDKLIFVRCDEQKRQARIEKRGFFDKNQLKKRENFQISLDKKEKISHYILNNNDGLSELTRQIGEIFPALINIDQAF
jgi:dephospho-CoA kinase